MKINILSQGITPEIDNSVGTALVKYLSSDEYHTFTGISAFASEAGIKGLSQYIEKAKGSYKGLNIIVGIDQKGTSKEALNAIIELEIGAYIFYQTGFSIFHPKIYLFEGDDYTQLIIGSSNLTSQGLFVNVEASIHLELSNDNQSDMDVLIDLKTRFSTLFDLSDPNLKQITPELIDQLVTEKVVPTEAERKEIQDKIEELEEPIGETVEKLIRKIFPKRQLPSIPSYFRGKKTPKPVIDFSDLFGDLTIKEEKPTLEGEYTHVWQRRKLPASSVEIAGSANTNPTGGLRLVQDKFQVNGQVIDQTTYFRNDVFGQLDWVTERQSPLVEIAIGKFEVIVLGESLGVVPLKIRHKPSGEAGQHNYTTSISWGDLSKSIQERNLTNRLLNIYRLDGSQDTFKLEIV